MIFQGKCFPIHIILTDEILIDISGIICIVIICFPDCDIINFKFNFSFPIKRFTYIIKKSK